MSDAPLVARRTFLMGAAAAAGVAALAGCTSGTSSSAGPGSTTIDFWSDQLAGTPVATGESAFFRAYEKAHPGITVAEHRLAKFDTQFKAAVSSQQNVDLMSLNVQYLRDYVNLGLVRDVTDPLAPVADQYTPLTWDQMHTLSIKDGKYGLPLYEHTCGIYYNTKVFAANNLEIPKTWDDVKAMVPVLGAKGIAPIVYAGSEPWWNPMWFNIFFYQETDNNGLPVNEAMMKGETSFHSDPFTAAISRIVELDRGKVLIEGNQGLTYQTATAAFVQGKAAMFYMGSWFTSQLPKDFEYGIFPTPTLTPALKSQPPGSVSNIYTMNATVKNEAAAGELLVAMAGPDFQLPQLKAVGSGVPLQPSQYGVNPLPAMRELEKIAPSTVVWLDALWEPPIITAVQQGVQAAIAGKSTPDEVTKSIADTYDTLRSQGKTFYKA